MKTVVILDDDFDFLYQLKMALSSFPYEIKVFQNSSEALSHIINNRPDLVIVDLMMETHDSGFVNAKKIKKQYPELPVILLTAVGIETGISFSDFSLEANMLQVNEIIDKGKSFEYIKNVVNKYLS